MEEIIEQLRERNQNVPVPLPLPSEDDLLDIEENLLISLPKEYRKFLLEASDVVYGTIEPATAADPHAHNYLSDVIAQAWEQGLPRTFLPICQAGEVYYCLQPDDTVVAYHIIEHQEDETWESIWDWIQDVWLDGNHT